MLDAPDEKYLKYIPAPEKPVGFDAAVLRLAGVCPNGTDPMLRFVWGMDVTEQVGEYTVHRYPDPLDKYVGTDRWILEGWQAPDVYDREQWEANKDVFGEWPRGGVWDYITTWQAADGGYLPLTDAALELVKDNLFWKAKGNKRALEDLLARRCELQVLKENRAKAKKAEIFADFYKNITRALPGDGFDPRKRQIVGKINEKGEYENLVPEFA